MSKCKYETSNGRCGLKGCYAYRHNCFTEDLCKCYEPQTNGDRIRAFTDDELAKWIDKMYCKCPWCDVKNPNCGDMGCTECIEIWLKQPPKEEEG